MKRLSLALLGFVALLATTSATMYVRSANAGGGGCHQPRTEVAGTSVELKDNCFLPTVLDIGTGDSVSFTSHDKQFHTVTGAGARHPDGWGDFEELAEGAVVTHTFHEPGVYPYFCLLHPGMVGAIVVDGGTTEGEPSGSLRPLTGATATDTANEGGGTERVPAALGGSAVALLAVGAGMWLWRRWHAAPAETDGESRPRGR